MGTQETSQRYDPAKIENSFRLFHEAEIPMDEIIDEFSEQNECGLVSRIETSRGIMVEWDVDSLLLFYTKHADFHHPEKEGKYSISAVTTYKAEGHMAGDGVNLEFRATFKKPYSKNGRAIGDAKITEERLDNRDCWFVTKPRKSTS